METHSETYRKGCTVLANLLIPFNSDMLEQNMLPQMRETV